MQARSIHDITTFTALDFPGHLACILWFAGCNMRCQYCYNPEVINGKGKLSGEEVVSFLLKRRGLLDGVVLSGGECTLHPVLLPLSKKIKELGFEIKLDTNGTRPQVVQKLLDEDLLTYIALDYKAPAGKFVTITANREYDRFHETLQLLCSQNKVNFEIRTTVHGSLLTAKDISTMQEHLHDSGYSGVHYLQNFRYVEGTPGGLKEGSHLPFTPEMFRNSPLETRIR